MLIALVAAIGLMAVPTRAGAVQITEFPLEEDSKPLFITAGPDGNMWFTNRGTNTIGRITMSGEVTSYGLGITPKADLTGIVAGPDGNLWFTGRASKRIGRITPSGVVTEFPSAIIGAQDVYGITVGPDGALWVVQTFNSKVVRIHPTSGALKEFPIPTAGAYTNIVTGPDGNLWVAGSENGTIVRLTPSGSPTTFGPLPATNCAAPVPCPYPEFLAVGPDGNVWFTESRGNAIGRITMAGGIAEYANGMTQSATAGGIVTGPEGNLWFTERAGQIGRISPNGTITEFRNGLTEKGQPLGIALGPDQNLWVTEYVANKIARVIPDVPPLVATGGPSATRPRGAIVTGTVRSRGAQTSYFFQYGLTTSYGRQTAPVDNGAGDDTLTVSAGLTKLKPRRQYHYRIVASNANGTTYGADMVVTTKRLRKGKVSVKPFKFYFAGKSTRGKLHLTQVNLINVKRGNKVSYKCNRCSGGPISGSTKAKRGELRFRTNLGVSAASTLTLTVRAKDGSKRVRTYGFRPSIPDQFLKKEACFAAKTHDRISCSPKKKGEKGKKGKGRGGKR